MKLSIPKIQNTSNMEVLSSLYFVLIVIGVGDLVKNYHEKSVEKTLTFAVWIQNSNQFIIQVNACGKFKKST